MLQTDDQRARLEAQYETLLRSLILLRHDSGKVSPEQIGSIVKRAADAASPGEARSLVPSPSAINLLQQYLVETVEVGAKRPTNVHGADAPVGGKDGSDKAGLKGADPMERMRNLVTAARYRDTDTSDRTDSGARYDGIGSGGDWSSPAGLAKMRDYAIQSGLPWAANNPDLLRLGPAAIGALAAVHLKGDGYKDLHDKEHLNFDNRTIVAGAEYMKRNGANYNEAAKAAAAVDGLKQLTPEERALHREAEKRLLTSKAGQSEDDAKRGFVEAGDRLIEAHHGDAHVKSAVERERKAHHVQKEREHKAELKANNADQHTAAKAAHNEQLAHVDVQAKAGAKAAKAALGAALG